MNDYYKNPAAQVAFENSDWRIFLAQSDESVSMLKQTGRVQCSEEMERQLKSLRMLDGEYSDILIYGPGGWSVGRLVLDPFSVTMLSSKGEDYQQIESGLARGQSMLEAIGAVAVKKAEARGFVAEDFSLPGSADRLWRRLGAGWRQQNEAARESLCVCGVAVGWCAGGGALAIRAGRTSKDYGDGAVE